MNTHNHMQSSLFKRLARLAGWSFAVLALFNLTLSVAQAQQAATPRFIVKWKADTGRTRTQALSTTDSQFRNRTGMNLQHRRSLSERMDVLQLDRSVSTAALTQTLSELNSQTDIEYAVLDQRRHALGILPNDPLVTATSGRSGQWYLLNSQPSSINAFDAWSYSMGGSIDNGAIVAVIDTGVALTHPDLAGKLLPGYDFVDCDQSNCGGSGVTFLTANDGDGWDNDAADPGDWISSADLARSDNYFKGCGEGANKDQPGNSSWHGTRVAGIIGAATNNSTGIAGIGWNARILPVRVLGKCGGWDSDIIAGMRWAAGLTVPGIAPNPNPAKVINLSLGGEGNCSAAYADVINQIRAVGASVVASAGNDSAIINTPANCSGAIAVVAVRHTGTKVGFSSLGAATIAAPGGNCGTGSSCVYSLDTTVNLGATAPTSNDYTDQINYNLGSSFSAPIVSGTIALMLGADSSLTPDQVTNILRSTAKAFPTTATNTCTVPIDSTSVTINESECNCTTSTCGAGLVNAYQAVLAVTGYSDSASSMTATSNDKGGGGAINPLLLLSMGWLMIKHTILNAKH
ncbi:MAG: S8 family peptidase [Steroidobacteraceae bacterium]